MGLTLCACTGSGGGVFVTSCSRNESSYVINPPIRVQSKYRKLKEKPLEKLTLLYSGESNLNLSYKHKT